MIVPVPKALARLRFEPGPRVAVVAISFLSEPEFVRPSPHSSSAGEEFRGLRSGNVADGSLAVMRSHGYTLLFRIPPGAIRGFGYSRDRAHVARSPSVAINSWNCIAVSLPAIAKDS